ncbi:two-component system response regulator [Bacillus sp. UMB0899]|uniref:response regulator transcription factor n=1 Tax=Metabacillus schmidteae TaxID=2730405 RepID=UPI000C7FB48B|nr:response regulator [Metabacillus schmidteae]PMC40830.1 two-component system response regulator [Bacillus sp. UMB0899]
MKVVITDDEIQIRKGLRMKVDWEKEGFQIVGEASNGKETLDLLNSTDVDIVITDVRMPIMDGIEFAKRANRDYPHVKVIVLSGYSDFEYVRSSLVEGVKDYLLKPVAPDELIQALNRIRSEVEQEKRKKLETEKMNKLVHTQLEEMKQQYILHLAKEELIEINVTLDRLQQLQLNEFTSKDVTVQFFTIEMRTKDTQALKELWIPFMMLCKEIAGEYENTYCFYDANYKNMLHFIHRVDRDKGEQITLIVDKVQKYVKMYLKMETVVGIGKIVTGLKEFKSGYISALLSWSQSKLGSHSQIIDGTINQELYEFSPDVEKRLVNSIENVSIQDFKHNMKGILGETNNQSMMSFSFAASRVLFLLSSLATKYNLDTTVRHHLIWNCQQSIWQLNTQQTVIDQLIKLAGHIIKKIQEARYSSNGSEIVANVREFLKKHYASEISLTSLSEQFHINSAYLSELFKYHVGQNFSDYLIQLRIEKAKEFLIDRQLKIIDVAYLVGFSNSGYFSTVFKKHVGKTPAEFRKEVTK